MKISLMAHVTYEKCYMFVYKGLDTDHTDWKEAEPLIVYRKMNEKEIYKSINC